MKDIKKGVSGNQSWRRVAHGTYSAETGSCGYAKCQLICCLTESNDYHRDPETMKRNLRKTEVRCVDWSKGEEETVELCATLRLACRGYIYF